MSLPSFEETNHPGYDEAFKNESIQSNQSFNLFKKIGEAFDKRKNNKEIKNLIDKHIADNEFIEIFKLINNGYVLNKKQQLACDIAVYDDTEKEWWNTLEKSVKEDITIPEDFLVFTFIYKAHSFFWEIGRYLYKPERDPKYPCEYELITELYEDKLNDSEFKRKIFKQWFSLVKEMANDTATYKKLNSVNTATIYNYPHEHYEYRIEYPIQQFGEYIIEGALLSEYKEVIRLLQNFPEVSGQLTGIDKQHAKQNSCSRDAAYLPKYMEKKGYHKMTLENTKNKYRMPSAKYIKTCFNLPWWCQDKMPSAKYMNQQNGQNVIADVSIEELKTTVTLLPNSAIQKLAEIKKLYDELNKDLGSMSPTDQFNYFNLYDKRLPELLEKYQNIDVTKRENIENLKEQNAQQILEESLGSIEEIFNQILFNINQEKLNSLSVNHRYIKEIKNNMK